MIDDDLDVWRGIIVGCVAGAAMWIIVIAAFVWMMGCSKAPKEEVYVDPATVETPSVIKPACFYKYSSETQMRTCPEEEPTPDEGEV